MTDWILIAKARGLDSSEPQVQALVATMTQLESVLADLKKNLPFDIEPAPAFRAVTAKSPEAR